MKVILLKTVAKLGNAGNVKEVSDGYFRNFLLPQKLAEPATPGKITQIQHSEEVKQKKEQEATLALRAMTDRVSKLYLTIVREADEKGTLYAALSPKDIVLKLKEYQCTFGPEHITLPGHIKSVGEYEIALTPAEGIKGSMKLKVVRKQ